MSLPPAVLPRGERGSTKLRDSELLSRWYVVALAVGTAMAALPPGLGTILTLGGNAVKARRLATENASRSRIWKEGFRVGFVASFPAGLWALLALATLV